MPNEFTSAYKRLNEAQKSAVDQIEGPVLVVAGPGTGKTQLLSLRVANILQKTDALPSNILCLTFTDSAQVNMLSRLSGLIGVEASQVAIHTFHSFGSHIIGTHSDYFREAFEYRATDDVTRYQILADLLEKLPHDKLLSSMHDGQFHYLKDIQSRISQLKQAGISPNELEQEVKSDIKWAKAANKVIAASLAGVSRINAASISKFEELSGHLPNTREGQGSVKSMGWLFAAELDQALEASEGKDTKPITAWKNRWLTKNAAGDFTLITTKQLDKLLELADIYRDYQSALEHDRLFDYDDMIVRLIDGLNKNPDLKAELQERYQYILVDEYQDTNGAQLKLLELLSDNPVNEGKPNLMVVGDDDQAIYGFQGANQSNIIEFLEKWPKTEVFVLTTNYRSTEHIVKLARQLIVQGEDRLENINDSINKELSAHNTVKSILPTLDVLDTQVEQFNWLANEIKQATANGQDPREIAVIAPKHKHLEAVVPYLQEQGIAISYERRENVLDQPHIHQLLQLARVITYLGEGRTDEADHLLPELLSYPWWNIDHGWLWEISLAAKKTKQPWLQLMRDSKHESLKNIADWLLKQAKASHSTPLEPMMDVLMGPAEPTKQFSSPYRNYYFGHDTVQDSISYLRLLSGLISLRTALRSYRPNLEPKLSDFVQFADLRAEANLPLRNDHPLVLDTSAIQLLTAHKAKGLEFDQVYLLNVNEHTWHKERNRTNNIVLPPNYAVIAPSGQTTDEKLRLFYVAVTRAKQKLSLLSYAFDNEGKESLPMGWLQPAEAQSAINLIEASKHAKTPSSELTAALGFDWMTPHFALTTKAPWRALLQDEIIKYQLSPTHLTAFLDVGQGGPKAFLTDKLLRFPQALSINAQFGDVMHALMQRLHAHFNGVGQLPKIATAHEWLEEIIQDYYFGPIEEPKAIRRGRLSLEEIYNQLSDHFSKTQTAEYDFAGEGVVVNGARLKGKIDCLDLDKTSLTASIADYKTGKPFNKWPLSTSKTKGHNEHKAHRYRQQLIFYKLLVENSRSFNRYRATHGELIFLEKDDDGKLGALRLDYDQSEVERLSILIKVVYERIINLDLPDTSHYSADFSGVLAFEQDLLDGKI